MEALSQLLDYAREEELPEAYAALSAPVVSYVDAAASQAANNTSNIAPCISTLVSELRVFAKMVNPLERQHNAVTDHPLLPIVRSSWKLLCHILQQFLEYEDVAEVRIFIPVGVRRGNQKYSERKLFHTKHTRENTHANFLKLEVAYMYKHTCTQLSHTNTHTQTHRHRNRHTRTLSLFLPLSVSPSHN